MHMRLLLSTLLFYTHMITSSSSSCLPLRLVLFCAHTVTSLSSFFFSIRVWLLVPPLILYTHIDISHSYSFLYACDYFCFFVFLYGYSYASFYMITCPSSSFPYLCGYISIILFLSIRMSLLLLLHLFLYANSHVSLIFYSTHIRLFLPYNAVVYYSFLYWKLCIRRHKSAFLS